MQATFGQQRPFSMRTASKASIYRNEVTDAAMRCIFATIARFQDPTFTPEPLNYDRPDVHGRLRPAMKQADRAIDWQRDNTDTIIRKINAADSSPGLRSELCGMSVFLYGAHKEGTAQQSPTVRSFRGNCATPRCHLRGNH